MEDCEAPLNVIILPLQLAKHEKLHSLKEQK